METTDLVDQTYAAFSEAPRPTAAEIAPHACGECNELRDRLKNYPVTDVPSEIMRLIQGDLPLLGPKALRYYLPRFIEFSLTHADSTDMYDYLRMHLCEIGNTDPYWLDRLGQFAQTERGAIAVYLEHIANVMVDAGDKPSVLDAADLWKCA